MAGGDEVMETRRSGRTGIVGPLAAVALIGAIGWLAAGVLPRLLAEGRLRRASTLISENPVRGFEFLEQETAAQGLSARQKERGTALAHDAIERICSQRSILRMIGGNAYDQVRPRSYVTASRGMMLVFEMPPGIKDLGWRIRVSEGPRELCEVLSMDDGRQARGEVPLPVRGAMTVDVDLVCRVGVYGTVTFPIAHDLRLVHETRGPSVILRAGATVLALGDGQPRALQVERGTPLEVELSDELGLSEMQWSTDGVACDPFDWRKFAEAQTRVVWLPECLTAHAAPGRTIELKASNSIGTTTAAVVRLFVRDPATPPIASAWIQKTAIQEGSTVHSREKGMMLRVTMAPGEVPEDLVVSWDGKPLQGRVNGPEVEALLEADVEGTKALVLGIRNAPVLRCAVDLDWTAPAVSVVLDPGRQGRELEHYRVHDVPIGAIVSISATDLAGVDRDATVWTVAPEILDETPDLGSEPAPGSEAARAWTRCFRCARPGEARVSVAATDLAGNRSTIYEYILRVADPMAGRTITVNGQPFPAGATIPSNVTRFDVSTEGGIDLDGLVFSLLDPEQMNAPIGQVSLERGALAGTRTGTLETSFLTSSARELYGVLSHNDRELSRGTITVDFVDPSFRVRDAGDAGVIDGIPRFYGTPGETVSLSIADDVGVDMSSISALQGAEISDTTREGSGAGVILALPEVIEEPVVVEVADMAGNRATFRFEIVTRDDPESQPDSQPDSRVGDPPAPPADEPPPLADLPSPKIVHPLLGTFFLVPARDSRTGAFYIAERELTLNEWLALLPKCK